ncbi:hypothetical protein PAEPH01_2862 [Pancytospora epiphaga]|nr:hypothetical protein PAEPH01_2862 [Pancytospora epiphaga]
MKGVLRGLRELALLDYKKKFMLMTDACVIGISAVLLQQDKKGEWVPVQWASKKFTPTERRYEITKWRCCRSIKV